MIIREYRTYHVTRNLARHALELDDKLYGSPLTKESVDWPLIQTDEYLNALENEKKFLIRGLEDMHYILRETGNDISYNLKTYSKEDADAHIYHKFTHRTFNYVEKITNLLQSNSPTSITINVPKARRQLYALIAALNDINVSIIRFTEYAKSKKE